MLSSLRALILRNGNVVRAEIARPETVARYLRRVSPLADYHVHYYADKTVHRVTGEGFLALYYAGSFSIATTRDALDTILEAHGLSCPRTRAKVRRAVASLLTAIETGADVETYAQIRFGLWYKVYFLTPAGAQRKQYAAEIGRLCQKMTDQSNGQILTDRWLTHIGRISDMLGLGRNSDNVRGGWLKQMSERSHILLRT